MKKLLIVGAVAALCLTGLSAQRASAQCCPPQCQRGGDISFNTGITFGVHWTPKCGHWVPNCPPPCYGYPPPYGYAAPLPAPHAGPGAPPPPPPPAPKGPGDVQSIGYNYPVSYDPYYGYNYGVPSYQDPGYWYGYGYGQ